MTRLSVRLNDGRHDLRHPHLEAKFRLLPVINGHGDQKTDPRHSLNFIPTIRIVHFAKPVTLPCPVGANRDLSRMYVSTNH